MRAMLHYKQGAYHLAALQWAEAGACFKASHAVYFCDGRRSLAPSMAINAALCYTLAADEGAAGATPRRGGEAEARGRESLHASPRPF